MFAPSVGLTAHRVRLVASIVVLAIGTLSTACDQSAEQITAPTTVKQTPTVSDVVLGTSGGGTIGGTLAPQVDVVASPFGPFSLDANAGSTANYGSQDFDFAGPIVSVGLACVSISPAPLSGAIAFIERGTCSFQTKTKHAEDAGYIAAVIYNSVGAAQLGGGAIVLGGDPTVGPVTIPTIGVDRPASAILSGLTTAPAGSVQFNVHVIGFRPSLTFPPGITATTDPGVCFAAIETGTATAVSHDGAVLDVTSQRNRGALLSDPYDGGVTTITWTTADGPLHTRATQVIGIADLEAPVVSPSGDISVGTDPGIASAVVSVPNPSATDNCPGSLQFKGVRSDGLLTPKFPETDKFPVGATTITWSVADGRGNVGSAIQTVTVSDLEPPKVDVPSDFTVNATLPAGAVVEFLTTSFDNVKVTSIDCTRASGSTFPIGVDRDTCTARDAAGNSASKSFSVTVLGAAEQLANLAEEVRRMAIPEPLRTQLVNGIRNSLSTPLGARAACPALSVFIAVVRTKGPSIPKLAPNYLQIIADATRIKSVLGCP